MLPNRRPSAPRAGAKTCVCAAVAALLTAIGCHQAGSETDPQLLAQYRSKFLLAEEPDGAHAVLDVRELFTGPVEETHDDLVSADIHGDIASEDTGVLEFTEEDFNDAGADDTVGNAPVSLEPQQVVVVGHIGGMPNPFGDTEPNFPWKKNSATFFIVDPGTVAELADAGHAHGEACDCPFCARHAADKVTSVAVVNLVEDGGQAIGVPAKELLDVKENETVVVRGVARMMAGELLVIDADGVYVRR